MKRALLIFAFVPVLLAQDEDRGGFRIVLQRQHKEIYDLYGHQNAYVTTDLVLHTMHLLFDYTLRAVEIDRLMELTRNLTRELYESARSDDLRAFLGVALSCLDPAFKPDARLADRIAKDLKFIEEHKGFEISATLPHKEDFSQYVPRGHYTRSEEFKRYFKAMMWYGRRMFRVDEKDPNGSGAPTDPWSKEHARAETRMALELVWLLNQEPRRRETWKKIDDVIRVFVGESEDLTVDHYEAIARKIWGRIPENPDERLDEFIAEAQKATHPRIDSSGHGRKGFNFIGQRSVPDSVISQGCVHIDYDAGKWMVYTGDRKNLPFTCKMTPRGLIRVFPRGLDIMAVFGSELAEKILAEEGDDQYKGYKEALAALKREYQGKLAPTDKEDRAVYWDWLAALEPLLKDVPRHAPDWMRTEAWQRKALQTALASWAELRHDTILYVKQSYTPIGRGVPPSPEFAGIEPYPELYRRCRTLTVRLKKLLAARGIGIAEFEKRFDAFAKELEKLERLSSKKMDELTADEHRFLLGTAGRLKQIVTLPDEWRRRIASEADASMAVVADVHTDNNPPAEVLEEAVGFPAYIHVTARIGGRKVTLTGGVFTYYEFRWPRDDRLTDEKWQKMLEEGKAPPQPGWCRF